MGAMMVSMRTHRMTELFGRLAPGATLEAARAELDGRARRDDRASIPASYSAKADMQLSATPLREQITAPARTILLLLLAAAGRGVHHRLLERRQPDPGALGAPRRRAGGARRARRRQRRAAPHAAGRKPGAVRRGRRAWRAAGASVRRRRRQLCRALLGARARRHRGYAACCGSARASRWRRPCCSRMCHGCHRRMRRPASDCPAAACGSRPARIAGCARLRPRRSRCRSCCWPAPARSSPRWSRCSRPATGYNTRQVLALDMPAAIGDISPKSADFYQEVIAPHRRAAGRRRCRRRELRAVARRRHLRPGRVVCRRRLHAG